MIEPRYLVNHLILGSDDGDNNSDPMTRNIFTIRADGSDKTYLTDDEPGVVNTLASWSCDVSKIVYMRIDSTNPMPYIWSMDADGSNKRQLTSGLLTGSAPVYSPDGKSILFTSYAATHGDPLVGLELWVMNHDGTDARPLTNTTVGGLSADGSPIRWSMFGSYSPDGTKITYASTQSGNSQIWVMNSDGSDKRQITFIEDGGAPDANSPAWSPDNSKIAYAGGFAGKGTVTNPYTINIYTVKPDDSERTQLTFGTDGLTNDIPVWSPDSQFIYFGSVRTGSMETWVMRADGTDQQPLFESNFDPSRRPVTFRDRMSEVPGIPLFNFPVVPDDLIVFNDSSDLNAVQSPGTDFRDISPPASAAEALRISVDWLNDSYITENPDPIFTSDIELNQRWDDIGDTGSAADGAW